ncbi:MAG: hypothetical protein WA213_11895 [Terriglobales bacterium]
MNDPNEQSAPTTLEGASPQTALRSPEHDDWLRAAADPALTEDQALSLLKRADLPGEVIERLAKNRAALKLRKVKIALACHTHTPRHVSVPLIRQFYTFDLMKVALSPVVPAEVKLSADEALIARLKTITLGERSTLARRASGRVAGALLLDAEERIMRAALENARLTEVQVTQALVSPEVGAALVRTVSRHEKWSHRRDVQAALLRTEHLSLSRALAFTREMRVEQLTEVLQASRLPEIIKHQLLQSLGGNPG